MSQEQNGFEVGDIVTRSSKGKQFRITGFWPPAVGKGLMASLEPLEGYTKASADVRQLTLIERPGGDA